MLYGNFNKKEPHEYTPNDYSVIKAWKEFGRYIDEWHVRRDLLRDIRFIDRGGEKILQAEYRVHVHFSKPVFRWELGWGGNREEEESYVWLDVPEEIE